MEKEKFLQLLIETFKEHDTRPQKVGLSFAS